MCAQQSSSTLIRLQTAVIITLRTEKENRNKKKMIGHAMRTKDPNSAIRPFPSLMQLKSALYRTDGPIDPMEILDPDRIECDFQNINTH